MPVSAAENLNHELSKASSYREFLRTYLEIRELKLSDFARATGFGRGFPGEVLSGKRRLTSKSYYPFEKALKVPLAGRKFFRALVAMEEPDIFPDFDTSTAMQSLNLLKQKQWVTPRRQTSDFESPNFEVMLKKHDVIGIYAASGSPDTGATFEQIAKRSRITPYALEKSLATLVEHNLLSFQNGIYYPRDLHLFFKTSKQSDILASLFTIATQKALARISEATESTNDLFFTSQFCINESSLPVLKKLLRETILKFVDDSVEADGDRVVRLLLALHL